MRILKSTIALVCLSAFSPGFPSIELGAAERPTLVHTCDPRPDIIPRPFYDSALEYRAVYNRPRYLIGKLAWYTSRTSQEAMVWEENYCAGNYECKDMPPVFKRYMYPKPWEILNTGPRVDPQQKPSIDRPEPAVEADLREPNQVVEKEEVSSRKNAEEKAQSIDATKDDAADLKKNRAEKPVVPSPSDR
jgi:hypothetical protein